MKKIMVNTTIYDFFYFFKKIIETIEETFIKLNTNENGLSSQEAEKRLQEYGFNEVEEKKEHPGKFIKKYNNIKHLSNSIFTFFMESFIMGNGNSCDYGSYSSRFAYFFVI